MPLYHRPGTVLGTAMDLTSLCSHQECVQTCHLHCGGDGYGHREVNGLPRNSVGSIIWNLLEFVASSVKDARAKSREW